MGEGEGGEGGSKRVKVGGGGGGGVIMSGEHTQIVSVTLD